MSIITKIKNYSLWLVLFTLPMYTRLNNILLFAFFALFVIEGGFKLKWENLKKHYLLATPLAVFFLLAVIAAVNHPEKSILRYLEMYWSLLIIPIAIISCWQYYVTNRKQLFEALFWGCIATLVICYGNVVYEMIQGDEPLHYFLRWRHLNHQFTAIADTHPAYLGAFIVCSIVYVFLEATHNKWAKLIAVIFLSLALIQLASRTAMLSFIIVLVIFLLFKIKRKWKEIALGGLVLFGIGFFIYVSSSSFLRNRLISTETIENDQRFSRYSVSYDIFKEYPIFGIGFGRKKEARFEKYTEYGFDVAARENYNAHNQFFEYLSVNGIIGGLSYILVALYLLYVCWKQRSLFFFLVVVIFLVANLTESMLVRIKGIEFFAIMVSLLLILKIKEGTNEHIDNTGL